MKTLNRTVLVSTALLSLSLCSAAWAKLPALSEEGKAKAAETSAKAAWTGKVGAYQLCQVQTRIAANYRAGPTSAGGAASAPVDTPPCTDAGAFAYTPAGAAPPLEAAGAHSPAKTATGPPSGLKPDAEQKPATK